MQKKAYVLIIILLGSGLVLNCQPVSLDHYLHKGIQNSPLLNEYRNKISSAGADSLLVRAASKPVVEANSNLQYSPYGRNFGYDEVITDGGNYSALAGVKQNIFNGKEINNKIMTASLLRQSAGNESKIAVKELTKMITDQYLTTYLEFSDLRFNESFLGLLLEENKIVRQLADKGIGRQSDYLSLLTEVQSQQLLVIELKSKYRNELMQLNRICGINDTVLFELSLPALMLHNTDDITRLPSFNQFKLDSMRLENEKKAIDLRYKPKLGWFADAGTMTSNPWNFYRHFGFSAGMSLNIPIYDGRQRSIEKTRISFEENSRQAYQNNFKDQYYLQVNQLRYELKALDEMTSALQEQVKTTGLLVQALKQQVDAGMIQMTEYINAVKSLRTAGRNLNLTGIRRMQLINEINFLLTP